MSKGLEALERIGKLEVNGLRVIPTKTIVSDYNDYYIIEKELKALEIFKTKQIEILCLRFSNSANEYNQLFGSNLTKEEYDLLKEVLL